MTASSKTGSATPAGTKAPSKANNKTKKAPERRAKTTKTKARSSSAANTPNYGVWPD